MGPQLSHVVLVAFDTLTILAVVLVTCSLLPAVFSKSVQRTVGWYNLMFQWLVVALSYTLLFGQQEGPPPPLGYCTFQALLVYALPPMGGMGLLCYFIEFHLIISGLKAGNPMAPNPCRTYCLVAAPWFIFLAVITVDVLFVERAPTGFYCHVDDLLVVISAGFVSCLCLIAIPLEVWTGMTMYRGWDAFKRLRRIDRRLFVTIYLRLAGCSFVCVTGFVLSTMAFFVTGSDYTSIFYPMLPITMAVAFGTQKDILRAWLFWRPPKSYGTIIFNTGTVNDTNNGSPDSDVILAGCPEAQIITSPKESVKLSGDDRCPIYIDLPVPHRDLMKNHKTEYEGFIDVGENK